MRAGANAAEFLLRTVLQTSVDKLAINLAKLAKRVLTLSRSLDGLLGGSFDHGYTYDLAVNALRRAVDQRLSFLPMPR